MKVVVQGIQYFITKCSCLIEIGTGNVGLIEITLVVSDRRVILQLLHSLS